VGILAELGGLLSTACFIFLAVRFADLAWRKQLGAAFRLDRMSLVFLVETALILVPAVVLWGTAARRTPRTLLNMVTLACLRGMVYRYVPTTIAYHPAPHSSYFPSVPELLMSIGYIALGIVAFRLVVKFFAVLPGDIKEWNYMFNVRRRSLGQQEVWTP
jgi:Ni/Fe-hydrogenase subunit HybB-like protein